VQATAVGHVVQDGDHDQRQQRRHEDAEHERDRQAVEDRVVEDEQRAANLVCDILARRFERTAPQREAFKATRSGTASARRRGR